MQKTALEKLEIDFMTARTEYEEAQKTLEEKKAIFEQITKKRNNKMLKELKALFNDFYKNIEHVGNFFNAFCDMENIGVDSDELMHQEVECVLLNDKEDMFIIRQIHTVSYNECYERDTFIPVDVSLKTLKEIFDKYIEKDKEQTIKEEKESKQRRYEEYLKLKKEFEGEEN